MINIESAEPEEFFEEQEAGNGDGAAETAEETGAGEAADPEPEESGDGKEESGASPGESGQKDRPREGLLKKKKKEKPKKKDPRDEKIAELDEKHLRLMAEFDNFRRRTEKEKEAMFETGARSVIEKILPVVDNFERALGMSGSETTDTEAAKGEEAKDEPEETRDPFMDGMKMVYKQLMNELEAIGVSPIEAVGKEFDPALHNAVMQVENEKLESGTVAQELQKGYTYRGTVVRHSMVSVVA